MIDGFLERILCRRPKSTLAKIAWLAFFLLFPIAYVAGSLLAHNEMLRGYKPLDVDRGSAIATARQFAADHGIDATSWSAYTTLDPSEKLLAYYRLRRDSAAEAAQSFSLPITIRVLLMSGSNESALVLVDQKGRVAGYDWTLVRSAKWGPPVDEAHSEAIASGVVARIPNLAKLVTLGKPEISTLEQHEQGGSCRKFVWHTQSATLPGLTFDIDTAVCGTQPVLETVSTNVDDAYSKANGLGQKRSLGILIAIYGIYIAILLIYSLYRYARRSFEREVSHKRTLLLGAVVAAALLGSFLTAIDEYVLGNYKVNQTIPWFPLIAVAIAFAVMGLVLAVAYEAGEGDLRELYPGKLTSLDALVRGKIFSRNVARSVLFGVAFAGWMLTLEALLGLTLWSQSGRSGADILKVPFFRYPFFAVILGQAISVTLIPASSLLLPMAFLTRNVQRVNLRNGLLLFFVIAGCCMNATHYESLGGVALNVGTLTIIVLAPFLAMDFLAVTFSLAAFQIAKMLAHITALSPASMELGIAVGCLGFAFVAIEAWAVARGREYSGDEVRPLYAHQIAERQLLQAEMAAAREAQLHLLPKSLPQIHGLSITAACIPARVVGGDFYDFFPLGENRLGIFIAEGGNRGIGSALTIALAKGFLMHTVRRNLSPYEVIVRLEAALGTYLEGAVATTHVAYAILDNNAGHIRYARTGEYPKVLVSSLTKERRIQMPGSGKDAYEGSAQLRGGDTVLLFTDGIARTVRISGSRAAEDVLRALSRKRREHQLADDLTAVVIRVNRAGSAMEVVA